MPPATVTSPAWLDLPPPDSLPDEVEEQIGPIAKKIGFVPNVARLLAITPHHFAGWWRYFDDLMRGPSGLTKTQREMIAVVVSAEARCPYCLAAHAAALRLRTKDAALVDRLAANYRHVELAPKERAMLDFAVKLTHRPEACDEVDLRHLRSVGFTDDDILHIVEVTAISTTTCASPPRPGCSPTRTITRWDAQYLARAETWPWSSGRRSSSPSARA